MIRGFYSARSGLIYHQEHMNTVSNNIANISTYGFKPMRTSFKDLMYQNINRPEAEGPANVGHGVKINKNDILMGQGALVATGRELDFMIEEPNGFFAAETASGDIVYSRAGNFYLSNDDDTWYLIDGNGNRILNRDGEAIEIEFDDDGNYEFDMEELGIFRFPNPYGLWSLGGNNLGETAESGAAELIENPAIKANYLEGSGVELANEMVKVIEASKAFSLNSRMIQVSDEIEQTVNSLR